ncbi:MAG: apolipoprotein N-acyltransferase [Sphingomonadales bacterium]|nr:apolipoprotein N-acyltransferase [Sphingomonadales bacterium]
MRPGLPRLGLAAALGAGVGAGQVPLSLWWLALPALVAVLALAGRAVERAAAGWWGFVAGFGYALITLYWIVDPFFVEPEVYGWMAPFALAFMAAGMGLFWTLGFAVGHGLGAGPRSRSFGIALGLAASDLARSYLFTGFPWGLIGHLWIETPVAQAAALIGAQGLGALTLGLAALAAAGFAQPWTGGGGARRERRAPPLSRALPAGVALVGLAGLWGFGAARLAAPEPVRAEPLTLRLVQPNAPQDLKWLPDYRMEFFFRHLDLTARAPAPGAPRPDLILWPETAVPFLLERPGDGLMMIAEAAQGVPVALGIQRSEGLRYYNSLAVIGVGGAVEAVYDKYHLVPFGEYVPLGDLAARLGLTAFAAQAGNGYSAGPGPRVLDLGRLGLAQPLICYEAVFPQDIRRAPTRPDWLMQVTNDAWFGQMAGPWQHLALARWRAIEFGLPLARAANTGVSAMIDARGRITASLGMGQMGALDAALPAALPPTLYARIGDLPLAAILAAVSAFIYRIARRYRVDPVQPGE